MIECVRLLALGPRDDRNQRQNGYRNQRNPVPSRKAAAVDRHQKSQMLWHINPHECGPAIRTRIRQSCADEESRHDFPLVAGRELSRGCLSRRRTKVLNDDRHSGRAGRQFAIWRMFESEGFSFAKCQFQHSDDIGPGGGGQNLCCELAIPGNCPANLGDLGSSGEGWKECFWTRSPLTRLGLRNTVRTPSSLPLPHRYQVWSTPSPRSGKFSLSRRMDSDHTTDSRANGVADEYRSLTG